MSGNRLDAGDVEVAVQARDIHGGVHVHQRGPRRLVPAQLPLPPGVWADRERELAVLSEHLASRGADDHRPVLVVITGPGGAGKTSLALRWLHAVRAEFGDGQLFADLRGFGSRQPARADEVLARFLRALGMAPESIPLNVDEQAARFRTLTADRRLIVVLDNARSAAQIRPLLPGASRTLVVVTTRRRLPGLVGQGAHYIRLGPLDEPGAVELLGVLAGPERTAAEPDAVRTLTAQCGRLPLALSVSGAYLAVRPHKKINHLVEHLADEAERLLLGSGDDTGEAMEDDTSVHATFTASYLAVPEDAQQIYRLAGLHPGPDFPTGVAASAAGTGLREADRLLNLLAGENLIEETPDGRWRFHDLARVHARQLAKEIHQQPGCEDAFERIAEWLLRAASTAALRLNPNRWWLGRYFQAEHRDKPVMAFADRVEALEWLEVEHRNLLDVARHAHTLGMHRICWEIVEAMWPLFTHRKLYAVWVDAHRLGQAAAKACGDVTAQARMAVGEAAAYLGLHEFDRATRRAGEAIQLAQQAGHRPAEASALEILGTAAMAQDRPEEAIEHYTRSRDMHAELDRPRGVALQTRHLGEAHTKARRYDEAERCLNQALEFFSEDQEPYLYARTLSHLAEVHLQVIERRQTAAAHTLATCLRICRRISSHHEEANILVKLARLAEFTGDQTTWRSNLQTARSIYNDLAAPEAEQVAQMLNDDQR